MNYDQAEALMGRIGPYTKLVMSPRRLGELRAVAQPEPATQQKPTGLWYGCGPAWLDWTMSEMPEWLADYRYVYKLELNMDRMLIIRTPRDFKKFEEAYRVEPSTIDWPLVAQAHAGVEICPYQGRARMARDSRWYYPWDVASGCVWNPAAVRETVPVEI